MKNNNNKNEVQVVIEEKESNLNKQVVMTQIILSLYEIIKSKLSTMQTKKKARRELYDLLNGGLKVAESLQAGMDINDIKLLRKVSEEQIQIADLMLSWDVNEVLEVVTEQFSVIWMTKAETDNWFNLYEGIARLVRIQYQKSLKDS